MVICMHELSDDAELDALMQRIRAELAEQQRAAAEGLLDRDVLPASWADFATLPEDAFVEAAYRVALDRSPSTEEATRFGWALRGGASRATHLAELLASPEARARGAKVPGVARRAAMDRLRRAILESGAHERLRPVLRVARGLRRLARSAPRLARLDETLAGVQRASVSEQTQRFATFALQQTSALRELEARVVALENRRLERVLLAMPSGRPAEPLLVQVPEDATLATLDRMLAGAARGATFRLPRLVPLPGGWTVASPVSSASPELLHFLAAAHGLAFEASSSDPPVIRPA
jgi:hypothetical protein